MSVTPARINLSLLSHTNAGKTTIARTLLREDIGEVSDRPHVTEEAESHVLIESEQGDALVLWDTPGFGDSVRLLKRLKRSGNPFGWFLTQVWDRVVDRPFWCSQQAMRNAREQSDVLLYVVNAAEDPGSATYVDAEMQILGWIGKPIVLLLNQLGPPRHDGSLQAELERWRMHLASHPRLQVVLPFDAFARCWVQEGTLLDHVEQALPEELRPALARLREAWRKRNLEVFRRSMQVLADQLAAAATDVERLAVPDASARVRAWLDKVALGIQPEDRELDRAQRLLAGRLDAQVRRATEELVKLHGLTGKATEEVLQRVGREFAVERPADADRAGIIGGLVSGALGGLAADLAAGGLTFGAGALLGGMLGAFGARGLTKAYNFARGGESGTVRWSSEFLLQRVAAAIVRYLAVAHFGRGRGEFVAGSAPAHWHDIVAHAIESRRDSLDEAWAAARGGSDAAVVSEMLLPAVTQSVQEVLVRLYPQSTSVFETRLLEAV